VAGYPVTVKAGQVAIEEAVERPYEQAMRHLRTHHEIVLGKELLEEMVKTVGRYWLEEDQQVIAQARAERTAPEEEISSARCLVFADGVMCHTDGAWHEVRVGTVRSEGRDGEVVTKSSIARLSEVESFGEDLWRNACRVGYRGSSLTAFIADGSHWLWGLAEGYFSRAIKIVDFWHVCKHVSDCAKVFYGEGTPEARGWSLKVSGHLRSGDVEGAMREVEGLRPGRSSDRREAKHELVTYLTNNRERMDYPRYEALGLPIGSGEVEAQCKTLVQARCKQSGMRWEGRGLESLLRVRCAVRDGRYGRVFGQWNTRLAVWQARRKRQERQAA
jgi:hypothetical protein